MRLRANLAAALASSVWAAIVGLAAVPFYLKYLGIEAYGLIGFFITLQSLLQLLDFGLAPTINREVARCTASGDFRDARALLRTLGVVYWSIGIVAALAIVLLAPAVAAHWLQAKRIPMDAVIHSVMLMGFVIACRWPLALYHSTLVGAQRLVISSAVSSLMLTLGSIGAIGVLAFVSPTVIAFFTWQAAIGLVHLAIIRTVAWRALGGMEGARFNIGELKRVWRFSAGMSAIALSGLILTQMDKIILSRSLGLSQFGHYMLATAIVGALYVIITPVFNAVYPRFSALAADRDTAGMLELYRIGTRLMGAILFPAAMFMAVFAKDFVLVWTGRPDIAASIAPIIGLLALGACLHGVMHFPYALQIANGMTRLPLAINALLMAILLPTILFLSLSYGAIGGAGAWLILHVSYMVIGTAFTHRYVLKGVGLTWVFCDIGTPLLSAALFGFVAVYLLPEAHYTPVIRLIAGAFFALGASAFALLVSHDLRIAVRTALVSRRKNAVAA